MVVGSNPFRCDLSLIMFWYSNTGQRVVMHSILDAWQGFEYAPASPILISIPFPTSILQPLRPVKPRIKMLEII